MNSNSRSSRLTVLTLWRSDWSPAQRAVMEWYMAEAFPDDTRFVWTVPEGSEAESRLEESWNGCLQYRPKHGLELIVVPAGKPANLRHKHAIVAAFYEEAIECVETEWVLFVEDDVMAPIGTTQEMLVTFENLPTQTASLMAIYRSRMRPGCICAAGLNGKYLDWPKANQKGVVEVTWTGGGFTLYKTSDLAPCRPFHSAGYAGWDVNLCQQLRKSGRKMFVDLGLRARHLCKEVESYCAAASDLLP